MSPSCWLYVCPAPIATLHSILLSIILIHRETPHPLLQNHGIIRSNAYSQLCLSALWNTANILILFFHSRLLPPSANIACDGILLLSLLASGIWITLAATTSIDGTIALNIRFNAPYDDFSGPSRRKDAVELIGICTTFVTAYVLSIVLPTTNAVHVDKNPPGSSISPSPSQPS